MSQALRKGSPGSAGARRCKLLLGLALTAALAWAAAASWKMLQFHARLAALENPQWQQRLLGSPPYPHPIVLFGDSQIAGWPIATSFGALPVVDRGVGGDWAEKAPPRFRQEVLPLQPAVVVILIGTNDIAHARSAQSVLASIGQLAAAARAAGAEVILCSLLPVSGEPATVRPASVLRAVNDGLRALAHSQGASYVDLHSAVVDEHGGFRREFTLDGLHPSPAGYLRMSETLLPQLLNDYMHAAPRG